MYEETSSHTSSPSHMIPLSKRTDTLMESNASQHPMLSQILDGIILIFTGIYLVYMIFNRTMFHITLSAAHRTLLLSGIYLVGAARLLLIGLRNARVWIGCALAALYVLVYHSVGYSFLLFLSAFSLAYVGMNYRRILNCYLWTTGVSLAITVLARMCGAIDDTIYLKSGVLRSSGGMTHPNFFAAAILFFIMYLWIVRRDFSNTVVLILCGISAAISYFYSLSRTALICTFLLFLCVIFHSLEQTYVRRRGSRPGWWKLFDRLFVAAFPLCGALTLSLMYAYSKGLPFAVKLNALLSRRLMLSVQVLEEYGVAAFGVPFAQLGSSSGALLSGEYQFVDSAYPLILIRYGWVFLVAACIIWMWMTHKALQIKDRRLALILVLISVISISERYFMEFSSNILLTMPLATFMPSNEERVIQSDHAPSRKKSYLPIALTGVFAALFLAALPYLFSLIKTFLQARHLTDGKSDFIPVFLLLLAVIALTILFFRSLYPVLRSAVQRSRPQKRDVTALGVLPAARSWFFVQQIAIRTRRNRIVRSFRSSPTAHRERYIQTYFRSSMSKHVPESAEVCSPGRIWPDFRMYLYWSMQTASQGFFCIRAFGICKHLRGTVSTQTIPAPYRHCVSMGSM